MGTLEIIERTDRPFINRIEAADELAHHLQDYSETDSVVLGIPRGGIVIADHIARMLRMHFDVILARKIGAPHNPELAIGAVSEDGRVFLHEDVVAFTGATEDYIEHEKNHELAVIRSRLSTYRAVMPKVALEGKNVVITDDGIATGATMQAAIWAVREENPASIIAAVPVGPADSLQELTTYADRVLCLRTSDFFYAIGQFYYDFAQVDDEEVLSILREHAHDVQTGAK
jgi:putative phosphoribosyl transferase